MDTIDSDYLDEKRAEFEASHQERWDEFITSEDVAEAWAEWERDAWDRFEAEYVRHNAGRAT